MVKNVVTLETREGIKALYPKKEIVAIKYENYGEISEITGIIKEVDFDREHSGTIKVLTFTGATKVIRDFNILAVHICDSMEQAIKEIGLFRLIPLEVLNCDTLLKDYQKYLFKKFANEPAEVDWLDIKKCSVGKSLEFKGAEYFLGDIVKVDVIKRSTTLLGKGAVQKTIKGRIKCIANLFIVLDCSTNYNANKEEITIKNIVNITKINR